MDFSSHWHLLLWSAGSRWVVGFRSCGPQSLQHRLSSCDSQSLEYAWASCTGARTRIPCIGRRVLYHWTTRDTVASSVLVIFQRGGPDTPCLALTPASAHLPTVPCTFLQKAKGCTNLISWPLKRRLAAILSSDIQVTESIKMLPPNASAESGRKPIFKNLIILHHTRFVTNRKGHIPSCFTPVWKSDYKFHSLCLESRFLSVSKHKTARGTGEPTPGTHAPGIWSRWARSCWDTLRTRRWKPFKYHQSLSFKSRWFQYGQHPSALTERGRSLDPDLN